MVNNTDNRFKRTLRPILLWTVEPKNKWEWLLGQGVSLLYSVICACIVLFVVWVLFEFLMIFLVAGNSE